LLRLSVKSDKQSFTLFLGVRRKERIAARSSRRQEMVQCVENKKPPPLPALTVPRTREFAGST
jgi:hypothetical protein